MNENVKNSIKIGLLKKFIIAWAVVAVFLLSVALVSFAKYSQYKKAQELAVSLTLAATDKHNSYKNDYKKLVEYMYDDYTKKGVVMTINGSKIDTTKEAALRREADKALGKLMSEAGYKCTNGSDYLKYIGFIDYTTNNMRTPWIVGKILVILFLLANLWYLNDSTKTMTINGDRVVCRKRGKVIKEFLVKDIKSVEFASLKGLMIRGNSFKYKINLLKNAEELKSTIMDYLATIPTAEVKQEIPQSNADELKKYKELLDSGIISQEEFDAKKKQLLGI